MWEESAPAVEPFAVLRECSLLREFTDVGVRILAETMERRTVGRGTYAFRAGEPSEALAVVAWGTLQLYPREGGAPLGELAKGDSLGGLVLLQGGEHLISAMAGTDVELLTLAPAAWAGLQQSHPRTALKLRLAVATDLLERLREAQGPLREFLLWQVSRRQADGR